MSIMNVKGNILNSFMIHLKLSLARECSKDVTRFGRENRRDYTNVSSLKSLLRWKDLGTAVLLEMHVESMLKKCENFYLNKF